MPLSPRTARSELSSCPFSDPHRLMADLASARSADGFPWTEALQRRVVAGYDDVVAALHQPDVFSSAPTVPSLPSPWQERFAGRVPDRGTLLGLDNPDHDRLRAAVNSFFMPRKLARFEPWIEAAAHELIDRIVASGRTDLKRSLGLPLALRTITQIVGLDVARSDWIGFALSFFLGPKDTHYAASPEEKADALLELHDYVLEVMAERKQDRRDDLISHVWNVRDAGEVEMTDFEMLSLFPGLMLAGHETTSNLICTGVANLLSRHGAYEAAQYDDASRARALEELLRFESAITGMARRVTKDIRLGGTQLRAGDEVFLAYQAASRDPDVFDSPDELRLDRRFEQPHLGFGQGVHACLGAPLARLLLRTELRVLHERLPGLRLDVPIREIAYAPVGEARAVEALPIAWDARAAASWRPARARTIRVDGLAARVVSKVRQARDVVELELQPVDGDFPTWQPGAHVDLQLAPGLTRQYSLCGDPAERNRWRIAIRREVDGRGGSQHAHDRLAVGDVLTVRGPRNNFGLVPAPEYLFVAGGIGITPLLPMIRRVEADGLPWRLLYLGRSPEGMVYVDDLQDSYGDRVTVWSSSARGRFDLAGLLQSTAGQAIVYCCGPEVLLEAVEEIGMATGIAVHVERFAPRPQKHAANVQFEVVLADTGRTVTVDADESVLDAVNRAGASVLSTCREGTCGSCEVRVLAGVPEHRDSVLSPAERAANEYMMTCVSRATSLSLTLEL
jgi:cytochrome P450/ferredoxin-NADP reductase